MSIVSFSLVLITLLAGQVQYPAELPVQQGSSALPATASQPISPGTLPTSHLAPAPAETVLPAETPPAPAPAPAGQAENLITFDPAQTELRWVGGNWQLVSAGILVKDFGAHRAEAWEALRVIRSLHLTQQGTVGSPRPVMEYWLSDGQAPRSLGFGLRLLPINQASLGVERIQGQWCLHDASRILFNFGGQQSQAEQALDIVRRYGFSKIGYVGWPAPLMIYFLGDGNGPGIPAAMQLQPQPIKPPATRTDPPAAAAQANGRPNSLVPLAVHQLSPPMVGNLGITSFRFEPTRVEIRNDRDSWQLVYGQHVLARLANSRDARQALGIVQHYRFTELCRIGAPEPSFSFFLARGQAPRGQCFGVPLQAFKIESLGVEQVGQDWVVVAGQQPLVNFGTRRDDAQELLQVIARYHFDHIGRIGPPGPLSMTFLVSCR
jgi:hypothetical protein